MTGTVSTHAIISYALLEAIAPEYPINQDEMGGCVWCSGPFGLGSFYAEAKRNHHSKDCPWMLVRRLLGDEWAQEPELDETAMAFPREDAVKAKVFHANDGWRAACNSGISLGENGVEISALRPEALCRRQGCRKAFALRKGAS